MPQRRNDYIYIRTFVCIVACLFVLGAISPGLLWKPTPRPQTMKAMVPVVKSPIVGNKMEKMARFEDLVRENNGKTEAASPHPSPLPEGEGTENMSLPEGEGTENMSLPEGEGAITASFQEGEGADGQPTAEMEPVEPAAGIAAEVVEPSLPADSAPSAVETANAPPAAADNALQLTAEAAAPAPEAIRRLPIITASIPSPLKIMPREIVYPETEVVGGLPKTKAAAPQREETEQFVADVWREPDALLQGLKELAAAGPTSKWATEVSRRLHALGPAVSGGSDEAVAIVGELADLNGQVPQLAATLQDRALLRKLCRTSFALGRRLDVWQEVVRLGVPRSANTDLPELDPQKLSTCLAEIDALTGDSTEGRQWRKYLLIDALKQRAQKQPAPEDRLARQLAQRALARMTQIPLTPRQRQFVTSGPMAALRAELRQWAAEPVGVAVLLRDMERYERTGLPSDARRLAFDCQHLGVSPTEARRLLAQRIDTHYRNANVRVAISEELLNRLIPERNWEYAPVNDRVLGRPVRGTSLMASEVAVRMLPDPHRVRMALEVTGEIAAQTTADAGPATFVNDSQSYYVARKPLEIDMKGIALWPAEVDVRNETRLRDVETGFDGIPLIGPLVKGMARSQLEQNTPAATREVKQKVAVQARERIDTEARQRLNEVVVRLNREVFDPLHALALDPQMIDGETTEKRFTMRLRLAGEDQLGSHTPRPQAPSDSLASVQVHESAINNAVQRLELDGRTFTLPELSKRLAARLNRTKMWDISPEHEDVIITFADKDAVLVRCVDGQVALTVSIAQLSKSPRKWKDFQVRAFYRPQIDGRSAQLVRDGVIHLIGQRLNTGGQIALRGIFSKAFAKDVPWQLMPERLVKEPKLRNTSITQFVIDDGWVGVSLGPKREASRTAARWK